MEPAISKSEGRLVEKSSQVSDREVLYIHLRVRDIKGKSGAYAKVLKQNNHVFMKSFLCRTLIVLQVCC